MGARNPEADGSRCGDRGPSTARRNSLREFLRFAQDDNVTKKKWRGKSLAFSRCYNALFRITCGGGVVAANLGEYIRVLSCGEGVRRVGNSRTAGSSTALPLPSGRRSFGRNDKGLIGRNDKKFNWSE